VEEPTQTLSRTLERDFEALQLPIGGGLVIERTENARKFNVQLLGYKKGVSLMISAPQSKGREVMLETGDALRVRLLSGKSVAAFETHVRYRCFQPFSYYHLSYPHSIEVVDVRNAERVKANLSASVDSEFVLIGDWPKQVAIENLSETGLCFMSSDFLGLLGHELMFSLTLTLNGRESALRLPGVIRNIEHPEADRHPKRYQVGVQFTQLEESERLVLAAYVL